jgi:DNA-binding PucR family transcriptional regulator
VIVVRAHHFAPAEDDWRVRVLVAAERAARAAAPGSIAAIDAPLSDTAGQILVLSPAADEDDSRRTAAAVARELRAALHGFTFAVGYSRVALDPADLYRAGNEALLAANVAEAIPGGEDSGVERPAVLAFEATGAYRLLLPAMSEDPGELQRFYAETVAPLVAYDEQYETDLVQTLETFLECDGNVANSAQRLFTHRHTIRYRLERVRDLCGLDVGSTDGREKLGLGLKAMRVLGIAAPRGPATERGAGGGRVPRGARER